MSGSTRAVLIDGSDSCDLTAFDRGLHFGDGVFETIACRRGRPRFLSLHCERLGAGCERLRIRFEQFAALRSEVEQLAALADASIVKVILTRGTATTRGYSVRGDEQARRIAICYEWPQEDPACWNEGVRVHVARLALGENPALAGLKHLNRLEQILARLECGPGTEEALLFSSSQLLISGTMSNVFLVIDGQLLTPHLDRCGVAGIMRRVILREAYRDGITVAEATLSAADLARADEIFLSNARIGIWPVRAVGDTARSPGPVTRRVQQLIKPMLEEPVDA